MTKRVILTVPIVASLLGILIWAVLTSRGDPATAVAILRMGAAKKVEERRGGRPTGLVSAPGNPSHRTASPLLSTEAVHDRMRDMEERIRQLEARKSALALQNKDLEEKVDEKDEVEPYAASLSDLLELSDTQRQSMNDLWGKWRKEDGGLFPNELRKATVETWLSREAELRSILTADQASELHKSASNAAQSCWKNTIDGILLNLLPREDVDANLNIVPKPKEEVDRILGEEARMRKAIGEYPLPEGALLLGANRAEMNDFIKEVGRRLEPALPPQQKDRLKGIVEGTSGSMEWWWSKGFSRPK
jgi:hypothetical protein